MALDWHIIGPAGESEAMVPLGEEAHAELFARVGLHRPHHGQGRNTGGRHRQPRVRPSPGSAPLPPLPYLARATDYYEDAAYAPGEVRALLAELAVVGPRAGPAAGVVAALAALCAEAVRRQRGVTARAD